MRTELGPFHHRRMREPYATQSHRLPARLNAYEWICLREPQLRARGHDPAARVCFTGHVTALRWQWLDSIGCWGSCETREMIDKASPHLARLHVSHAAFKKYKARHGLLTRAQFARIHGPAPWDKAQLCAREHARAESALGRGRYPVPIGSACAYAVATARVPVGLLPVEVVLWVRLFDELLMQHGVGLSDWLGLEEDEKAMLWKEGIRGEPMRLEDVARAPAVLHLPEGALAAAE